MGIIASNKAGKIIIVEAIIPNPPLDKV